MPIGTSLGAFYDDGFHQAAAQWNPDKYDADNKMVQTPNQVDQNKQMDKIEETELGGTPVSDVIDINPMTVTENGVMPLLGGAVKSPETVKSAALQYKGKTYEGQNHGYALSDIMDAHGDVSMKDIKDGFTTSKGRFVSREEAFGIAKGRNQIDQKVLDSIPHDQDYNMLLSEDLKPIQ